MLLKRSKITLLPYLVALFLFSSCTQKTKNWFCRNESLQSFSGFSAITLDLPAAPFTSVLRANAQTSNVENHIRFAGRLSCQNEDEHFTCSLISQDGSRIEIADSKNLESSLQTARLTHSLSKQFNLPIAIRSFEEGAIKTLDSATLTLAADMPSTNLMSKGRSLAENAPYSAKLKCASDAWNPDDAHPALYCDLVVGEKLFPLDHAETLILFLKSAMPVAPTPLLPYLTWEVQVEKQFTLIKLDAERKN